MKYEGFVTKQFDVFPKFYNQKKQNENKLFNNYSLIQNVVSR